MSDKKFPKDLQYKKTHEWIRQEPDGTLRVGITHHAQRLLGDLVYVELPEMGAAPHTGEVCCTVESVKAASDVFCPVAGEVIALNEALADEPNLINESPYGDGWLFLLKPVESVSSVQDLMDVETYAKLVAQETHPG